MMWNYSAADKRHYKRLAVNDRARRQRQDALQSDLPRRMAILKRVKAGEITLKEGQKLIRDGISKEVTE